MRKALFEKLSTFHLGFFHQSRKGDLMSVLSGDVVEIENSVVSTVQVIFRDPLVILVYFIMLFSLSVKLSLFTILFFPVSGYVITSISKKLRRSADISQSLLGRVLSVTEETISGIRIVKAFQCSGLRSKPVRRIQRSIQEGEQVHYEPQGDGLTDVRVPWSARGHRRFALRWQHGTQ
jgi:ABC-type multidrug transport system fused ATPase/permease subunit